MAMRTSLTHERTLNEARELYSIAPSAGWQDYFRDIPADATDLAADADTAPLAYAAAGFWRAVVEALEDGAQPARAAPHIGHPLLRSRRLAMYVDDTATFNANILLDMAAAAGAAPVVCYLLARSETLGLSQKASALAPAVLSAHSNVDDGLCAVHILEEAANYARGPVAEAAKVTVAHAIAYMIDFSVRKRSETALEAIWRHCHLDWNSLGCWTDMLDGPLLAVAPMTLPCGTAAAAEMRRAAGDAPPPSSTSAADLIALAQAGDWGAFYHCAETNDAIVEILPFRNRTFNLKMDTVADLAAALAVTGGHFTAFAYIVHRAQFFRSDIDLVPLAVLAAENGHFELAHSIFTLCKKKPDNIAYQAFLAIAAYALKAGNFIYFVRTLRHLLYSNLRNITNVCDDVMAVLIMCSRNGLEELGLSILRDIRNRHPSVRDIQRNSQRVVALPLYSLPNMRDLAKKYLLLPPNYRGDIITIFMVKMMHFEYWQPESEDEYRSKSFVLKIDPNFKPHWTGQCPMCYESCMYHPSEKFTSCADEYLCRFKKHGLEAYLKTLNKPVYKEWIEIWMIHACLHSDNAELLSFLADIAFSTPPDIAIKAFNRSLAMLFSASRGEEAAVLLRAASTQSWAADVYAKACVSLATSGAVATFAERFRNLSNRLDDARLGQVIPRVMSALSNRIALGTYFGNCFLARSVTIGIDELYTRAEHPGLAPPSTDGKNGKSQKATLRFKKTHNFASINSEIVKCQSDMTLLALNVLEIASTRSANLKRLALQCAARVASTHTVLEAQEACAPLVDDPRFELFASLLSNLTLGDGDDAAALARNWAAREDAIAAALQKRIEWEASALAAVSAKHAPVLDADMICVVCRDPLAELFVEGASESNAHVLCIACPGKHVFHRACILAWLELRSVCPMCKHKFDVPPYNAT